MSEHKSKYIIIVFDVSLCALLEIGHEVTVITSFKSKDNGVVVIMVKHNEIRENMDKLAGKMVLDCHNICPLPGVYHL